MTHRTAVRVAAAALGALAVPLSFGAPALALGRLHPTTTTAASGAAAPTAAAQTCAPAVLSAAQTAVESGISARLTRLSQLLSDVATKPNLTGADRSTLTTDLQNEQTGVGGYKTKVPADTTCAEVKTDGQAVVQDYRVYVVMTPQVHLTEAADTETAAAGQLASVEPQITAAIAAAKAKGHAVTGAEAAFTDLGHQVTTAQQASAGVTTTVLGFTPASYPGCEATFHTDWTGLESGRDALKAAAADLHTIRADLASSAG